MNEKMKNLFAGVGVVASVLGTVVGAIEIYSYFFSGPPRYRGFIYLNEFYKENEKFYRFLEKRNNRIVYIDSTVDISPFTIRNMQVLQICNNAYPHRGELGSSFYMPGADRSDLLDGYVYNKEIVLPIISNTDDEGLCYGRTTIYIVKDSEIANLSYGGSGVIMFRLNGFFEIEARHYSGPERRFYLRQLPEDVALRLQQER